MFLILRLFLKAFRGLTRRLSLILVLIIGLGTVPATAQIVPNGLGTQVNRDGNTFNIQGGTQAGRNLFHSFYQFGLNQGQTANFWSNPAIANILARVNGGSASYINGLIQVLGGRSNLFLMNPSGIVFGPNASLNVPAAFTATTADRILFPGGSFHAYGENNFANLAGDPIGFAFDRKDPAAIVNEANLTATSVSLVAGQVINTGKVTANQITIAAVPGENLVRLSQAGQILSLEFNPQQAASVADASGNIPITRLPELLTGGGVTTVTANPDQTVTLAGVAVPMSSGSALIGGVLDASNAVANGGQVGVFGTNISLVNAEINASGLTGGGEILIGGEFQGKGTQPNALNTWVNSGSILRADAVQVGNGGRIIVWADGTTKFAGAISAKGGQLGGDGGFAEVSGKETLNLAPGWSSRIDLSAPAGKRGTLLLDPNDINISGTAASSTITDPESSNQLLDDDIAAFLENTGNLTIQTTGSGGSGIITIDGDVDITWSKAHTFTLKADQSIVVNSGAKIENTSATTGFDAIVFNAAGTTSGTFVGITIDNATLKTNGGNIQLTGKGGNTGFGNYGIYQINGAQVSTTSGNITYIGTGGNGTNDNVGVSLTGSNTKISSDGGAISITGTGQGINSDNYGILQVNGAQVSTTNGNIAYIGTGGNGTNDNVGVFLSDSGTKISSDSGAINIIGTGQGTGLNNYGIIQQDSAQVSTTSGNITYTGTGAGTDDAIRTEFGSNIIGDNTSGKITLTSTNNGITLNNVTVETTNNITINSPGDVGQNNVGGLFADGLELKGTGAYTLTNPNNNIAKLAATGTGNIKYTDTNGFVVGTVNTTNGITAPGKDVTLTAGGAVTQTEAITASGLELLGGGSYTLTNTGNNISTLAANTTNTIKYTDANGFDIGTVNTVGVNTGGNNLTLTAGGAVTQTQAITASGLELLGSGSYTLDNTGNNISTLAANTTNTIKYTDANGFDIGTVNTVGVNTGGNNLTLTAGGAVTQTQAITASGLELLGSGSYTLDNTGNNISTLAANTTNTIKYTDTDGFDIGTVNTVGINTNSNDLTLKSNSTTDTITFTKNVTTGTGNLTVEAGTIDQTGGVITTTGTASFIATKANTGNVVANNVNVGGTVLGDSEIGGDFTLTSTGNVTQALATTLKVAGKTTITAPSATITNPGNVLPFFVDTAGNTTIENVGTIDLPAQTVTGNLSVTALATGNAYNSVFTGSAINLNQNNDFGGTVSFNTKTDTFGPTSGAPGITQSGAQTVAGTSTFNAVGGTITLNDAGNAFGVAVTLNTGGITGGDISLTNNGTTTLGNVTAGNTANVTLNSSGATSQVAGTAITAGGLELLGSGNYTLTNASNDVQSLTVKTSGNVKYQDANTLSFDTIGTVGVLDLGAVGTITQTSNVNSSGKVDIISSTGNILATGQNITANNEILLTATTGKIEIGNLSSNSTSGDRQIDLFAPVEIKTGNVTTQGGGIEIITSGGTYNTDSFGRISNLNFNNKNAGPVQVGDVKTNGGQIILASPDPNNPLKTGILDSSGGKGNILILSHSVQVDHIIGGSDPVNILSIAGFKATGQDGSGFSIKTNGGLIDIQYALTGTFTVGTTTGIGTKGKITNGLATLTPTQTFQCFPADCGVLNNISIRPTSPTFASAFNPPTPPQPPQPPRPDLQTNPIPQPTLREVDTRQLLDVSEVLRTQLDVATEEGIFSLDVAFGAEFANYLGVKPANTLRSAADVRKLLEDIYKQTGRKTAIIYWVLDQLYLNIVLITPGVPQGVAHNQGVLVASVDLATGLVQQPKTAPLTYRGVPTARRDEVIRVINRFRNRLGDIRLRGDKEYLKDAQALYRWLIEPIEPELQAQGIDTLLAVPDKGIRLLPLAALHDGKQFLIEKYNVAMTPSVNLISTRYRPLQGAEVLAMGASTFADEEPLPSVPTELKTITSVWPGRYFLNQDFTPERLVQERKSGQFRIVHLATHATFKPGDLSESYIVFGNNQKLPVTKLPELSLKGVELFSLGACRTLIGDGTDPTVEFGFAGLAVKTGVETAVASLWNVDDTATMALMTEFYRYLQKTPIKAEALRQAQLALMQGKTKVEGGQLRLVTRSGQSIPLPPELAKLKDLDFSSPHFWAGFSMIGSPW